MKEIWKDVEGHTDYQVSNLGKIRSKKTGIYKNLTLYVNNKGYIQVSLDNKKYLLHRLIAQAFINNKNIDLVVNHIDGNKKNNNINNLEWCTTKENIQHAYRTGLMDNTIKASFNNKSRAKKINQYKLDGTFIKEYMGSVEAEKELKQKGININARNIRKVCEGKRNKAGGFIWEYAEKA